MEAVAARDRVARARAIDPRACRQVGVATPTTNPQAASAELDLEARIVALVQEHHAELASSSNQALERRTSARTGFAGGAGRCTYKRTGSLADVAELLGDSKRVAGEHYIYALTDYREVDRTIALARAAACALSRAPSPALDQRRPGLAPGRWGGAPQPSSPGPLTQLGATGGMLVAQTCLARTRPCRQPKPVCVGNADVFTVRTRQRRCFYLALMARDVFYVSG
jgi:hypothetical protein